MRFTGAKLGSDFLQQIPVFLLSPESNPIGPALQILGRALLCGTGSDPMSFDLEFDDQRISLREFPHVTESVPWPRGRQSGTFYLRKKFSVEIAKRYWNARKKPFPEVATLTEGLTYLPIPWSLNEQAHPGRLSFPPGSVVVVWHDETILSTPLNEPIDGQIIKRPSPIHATAVFCIHPDTPRELTTIQSGLTVELPPHDFPSSTTILFWVSGLATDLSGRNLNDSLLLEESLETLEELQIKAWTKFANVFSGLSPTLKRAWLPLLQERIEQGFITEEATIILQEDLLKELANGKLYQPILRERLDRCVVQNDPKGFKGVKESSDTQCE